MNAYNVLKVNLYLKQLLEQFSFLVKKKIIISLILENRIKSPLNLLMIFHLVLIYLEFYQLINDLVIFFICFKTKDKIEIN